MNSDVYRFNIGQFKCTAVSDGTMNYVPPMFPPPATLLCINAPREQLERTLNQQGINLQQWKEWTSHYTCLLIDTGTKRVLVDTGAGNLGPTTGKLLSNLKQAGVTPYDIDMVIISHAHPDHLGGNTDNEGKPVFPRARWVIGKDEWQFWTSGQAEQKLPEQFRDRQIKFARKNLLPIKDKIELINGENEIVPGIRAIAAPGHTPGQIVLNIVSGGEQLLYISDLIIHPLHLIEPQWCAAVDIIPEIVAQTRRKILQKAADEKSLVMAFHFPFPGLGHVAVKEKAWDWLPI